MCNAERGKLQLRNPNDLNINPDFNSNTEAIGNNYRNIYKLYNYSVKTQFLRNSNLQ